VSPDRPAIDTAPLWQDLVSMNARWNAWKPGDVMDVNLAIAAGRPIQPAPGVQRLIRLSALLEARSMGFFNAGIGGLVGTWGFHDDRLDPGRLPAPQRLAQWRDALPSLWHLEWQGGTLRSSNPSVRLDFGAVAKGVAIDDTLDRLAAAGATGGVLNLGGNLAGFGRAGDRPWQVGIRDPLGDGVMATLALRGREAVVTSGSYERFRWLDGRRVTHIIDPRSGEPAPELVSVTVVHSSATLADAAATALLVAGPGRWPLVAERLGVQQVLVVGRDGEARATPALAARLAVRTQWSGRLRET
jgi:thiamine biosynthesis lipoprotein